MKAKLIFLLFILTLLVPRMGQAQGKIVVTMEADKTPEPYCFGYTYLRLGIKIFDFDSKNRAECVLEGEDFILLTVYNQLKEKKVIYMEDGDHVKLKFDGESLDKSLVITGGHESVQKYIESLKLIQMPNSAYKQELASFVDSVNKYLTLNLGPIEACAVELNKSTRKFVEAEKNRIRNIFHSLILNYPRLHSEMNKIENFQPGQDFYDILVSYIKEDPSQLSLGEYHTLIVESTFLLLQRTKEMKTREDRISGLIEYFQANFKNDRVRQFFIHKQIIKYVEENGIRKTPQFDDFYRKNVTDKDFVEKYRKVYDGWYKVSPGQQMFDFVATDASGKEYSLKDFKEKTLLIYLWPNVYPSQKEYKNFQKFEALFRERNISLVCLSMEKKPENWKTAIQGMATGTQLLLQNSRDFIEACHYTSSNMHQVILVAPDGKIVEINAPLPSLSGFEEFIRLHIKI